MEQRSDYTGGATSPDADCGCTTDLVGYETQSGQHEEHGSVGQQLGQKVSETAQQARAQTEKLVSQAADTARQAATSAQQKGKETFYEQKSRLSDHATHYSSTVRRVAEKLREDDDSRLAGIADTVADRLDTVAGYLERRDLNGLFDDVQRVARQRSDLFFGGMFVAGLALARFLKASGRPRQNLEDSGSADWDSNAAWSERDAADDVSWQSDPSFGEPKSHSPAFGQTGRGDMSFQSGSVTSGTAGSSQTFAESRGGVLTEGGAGTFAGIRTESDSPLADTAPRPTEACDVAGDADRQEPSLTWSGDGNDSPANRARSAGSAGPVNPDL